MGFLAALLLSLLPFSPALPASTPTPSPAVGALFSVTSDGKLGSHFCTGTVVHSRSGDVVLTAAHCLAGQTAASLAFVPEYADGREPVGVWRVAQTFVDQAWAASADPDHDVAFFTVERRDGTTLESLTGGERIGVADAAAGKQATVVGYPAATDEAVSCTNALRAFSATQLEFDCAGYTNGTSGSALVVDSDPHSGVGTVVGVIGGYEQGGTTADVSYAAAFGPATTALYRLAGGA